MLNVMADTAQSSHAAGFGEGVGGESDMNSGEETLCDEVATSG